MVGRGEDALARGRRAAFPRFVHQPPGSVAEAVKAAVAERLEEESTRGREPRELMAV